MTRKFTYGTCCTCKRENIRIAVSGQCQNCYRKELYARRPELREERKEYMRQYHREHERDDVNLNPLQACKILADWFEAHKLDVDAIIWWMGEARKRNPHGGSHSERGAARHFCGYRRPDLCRQ